MADKIVTVAPSGGDYESLAAAFAGEFSANPILTASGLDGNLYIMRQGTWASADGNRAPMGVFTVDASHRVIIIDESTGAGVEATSGADGTVVINTDYTEVYGLRVRDTSGAGYAGLMVHNSDHVILDRCRVYDCGWHGIFVRGDSDDCCVRNCWVDGCAGHAGIDFYTVDVPTTHYAYNNIVHGCGEGIVAGNGTTVLAVNNYAGNNTTDYAVNGTGAFSAVTDCFSSDETQGTTLAAFSTANFTSVTDGSEDFRLVEGSDLIDAGTDLSAATNFAFDTDYAGDTRSGTWDVGLYNYGAGSISVSGVSLNQSTVSLEVGQTSQLTATITPSDATNKAVTWSTTASGIATVTASGLVTAIGAGDATITVTTADGGFTDSCAFSITAETVYQPGDTFNMGTANVTLYAKWNVVDGPAIIDHTNFDPASFSDADVLAAAALKVYFEHASTGQDIVGNSDTDSSTGSNYDLSDDCGLALAYAEDNRYLMLRESFEGSNDPSWFTSNNGLQDNNRANPTPLLKLTNFLTISGALMTALGAGVAFYKHCWIDVWESVEGHVTDGAAFANTVISGISSLEAQFPTAVFPYVTMPLQTDASYAAREAFNSAIRTYCLLNDKWLYDIADLQCHTALGVKTVDGDGREVMVASYARDDGGHLSDAGALRMAKAFWTLLIRIARAMPLPEEPM